LLLPLRRDIAVTGSESGASKLTYPGCRIYVDVVFNHMTASFGDATGTGNSRAYTDDYVYPAVPYGPADFHNPICGIQDYDYGNNAAAVSEATPHAVIEFGTATASVV
jgi:hypothetical protein